MFFHFVFFFFCYSFLSCFSSSVSKVSQISLIIPSLIVSLFSYDIKGFSIFSFLDLLNFLTLPYTVSLGVFVLKRFTILSLKPFTSFLVDLVIWLMNQSYHFFFYLTLFSSFIFFKPIHIIYSYNNRFKKIILLSFF